MAEYEIIRPRRQTWLDKLRSIKLGPWNPKDPAIARYFGGRPVSSGVSVNEQTAMNYSAVWGAVTLISGSISILPLEFYRRERDGSSKTKFRTHPLYRLLHDRANPQMGSSLFRRTMQQNKLVWGNAYAEIERDASNRPIAMWPLLSYAMTPYLEGGMLRYRYQNPGGRDIHFDASDIVHLRGPSEDGICGVSAIRAGRESIGIGIAAERFAGRLYSNGLNVGGAITYPVGIGKDDRVRKENREALEKAHTGVDNAHRFLALYEGATFQKFNIQPDDAQFLESRIFQVEEICRWFNLPPHKLKDLENATYSNIGEQNLEYLTDSLEPHLTEWEEELTIKLVSPLEQGLQIVEFNREGFLRSDAASRATLQSQQFSTGLLTPNEGRALENRNPVTGGEMAFVPLNVIPIDLARPYWEAHIEATKQPKQAPQPFPNNQPAPAQEKKDKEIETLREALDLARSLTQKAEDDRDREVAQEKQAHAKTTETLTQANDSLEQANRLRREVEAREFERTVERDGYRVLLNRALDDFAQTAMALRDTEHALIGMTFERDDKIDAATEIAQLATKREQERDAAALERDALKVRCEMIEGDYQRVCGEVAAARDGLASLQAELATERERSTATAESLNGETVRVTALQGERDSAKMKLGEVENDLNVSMLRIKTLEGDVAKLQSGVDEQRAQLTELAQREKDATSHSEALSADLETTKTDLARARADIASELDKQKTQKAVLLAAMRSLFVDATERLIYREAERARKNQQTPDKLRSWAERFYDMHKEHVRAAFQPLVGPWTAITGGAPGTLLDRLVDEHIAASRTGVSAVLDQEDPEDIAANLERTLMRWEKERAESMADALVREGMAQ